MQSNIKPSHHTLKGILEHGRKYRHVTMLISTYNKGIILIKSVRKVCRWPKKRTNQNLTFSKAHLRSLKQQKNKSAFVIKIIKICPFFCPFGL
jgi:Leu/Phe-tRNA-protein transferase